MVYVRQERLPGLKQYKYSSTDRSLVSKYVLKPFYTNVVIKMFPMSMAPNLITLTGFCFVIINVLTMLYYSPTLDQQCPPWVYASWSIGLFLYQTFDAVDGTQARRTKQSGPLGELFDHGVDALNTCLEVLLFSAAMNWGQSWKVMLTLFASLLTFYVQTWDEFHTKTLSFGLVSGPVEGILTLCVVYMFTAIKGSGLFWQQPMLPTLGVPENPLIPNWIHRLAWDEWYMVYGALVLVYNTVSSAQNVLASRRAQNKNPNKALLGLAPFFTAWTLITAYLYLNPTILSQHLIPFVLYVGLINAYSVGQMITAHLTRSRFPYMNILIAPLLFGIADSLGPILQDRLGKTAGWPASLGEEGSVYRVAFVFMCLGLAVGVYGSFVVDVIVSICDYLDIWCLTIKHPVTEETKLKKAQ